MAPIGEIPAAAFLGTVAAALVAAAGLCGWFRHYALARQILDHPNERSSHTAATPRGGGVAIVCVAVAGLALAALAGGHEPQKSAALAAGGLLVAGVGWWDDRWELAARWRFLAHLCASGIAVAAIGPVTRVTVGSAEIPLSWAGAAASLVGIAWLINVTNFMDGIDGIAASEAAFVSAALAACAGSGMALPAAVLFAGCCGFLFWNWPPARIFMGDVGSGFLGFMMGALILGTAAGRPERLWGAIVLPGAFIVDGTFTLLRRLAAGRNITQAHRSHAYQQAAQRWGHRNVTLAFLAVNLFWVLPLALAAWRWPGAGAAILVLSWIPMLALAVWQNAGTDGGGSKRVNAE